jgi:TPP-dependent 2-oxoacid decarboxylase
VDHAVVLTSVQVATTMGVGELSALNGIGGAYTEEVKVIHIVGTTSTEAHAKRLMIHHNLGPNPDHKVGAEICGARMIPHDYYRFLRKSQDMSDAHIRGSITKKRLWLKSM